MPADLEAITRRAEEARELEAEVASLDERLSAKKAELARIYTRELVDLFHAAEIDHVGLPARGNLPAVDLHLKPFFSANIAAKWEAERKQEAYDYLISINAGDLIKCVVTIPFAREERDAAHALAKELVERGLVVTVSESVNHQTLTAWLREQVDEGQVPDLAKIGGVIGQVVTPKERTPT